MPELVKFLPQLVVEQQAVRNDAIRAKLGAISCHKSGGGRTNIEGNKA
jgi:hypothetical protein